MINAFTPLFLVGKNVRIFADSHFFPTKYNSVFVIFVFENLTKRLLTTSLISKNWPLVISDVSFSATVHQFDICRFV